MKKINKILLVFLMTITLSLVFIWEFVQSSFVAEIISTNITKITKEKFEIDVRFDNLEFQLFPPSVGLKNIVIDANKEDFVLKSELQSLGLQFNIIDIFKTKLTVSNLKLEDGYVFFQRKYKKNTTESLNSTELDLKKEFIKDYLNLMKDKSPVQFDAVELKKINLDIINKKVTTHYASIEVEDEELDFKLELRNFDLGRVKILEEIVDSLLVEGHANDNEIIVKRIKIEKDLNKVISKGKVKNYKSFESIEYDLISELDVEVKKLHKYLKFSQIGNIEEGFLSGVIKSNGVGTNFTNIANLKLNSFKTDFLEGQEALIETEVNAEYIKINKFEYRNDEERLKLLKPFELINLKSKKFVEDDIYVETSKLRLESALHYLKATLNPLKGELTGKVNFHLNSNDFQFYISENTFIENFEFKYGESKPIVQAKKVVLNKSKVNVTGSNVDMNFDLEIGKTKTSLVGKVKNGNFSLRAKKFPILLQELGPFAGFNIEGEGFSDLDITINNSEKFVRLKPVLSNFSFMNYKLENLSTEFNFDIEKNTISLTSINGKYRQSELNARAQINLKELTINAKADQKNFLIKDLKEMYGPIFGNLDFLPDDVYGSWATNLSITGGLNVEDIKVKGNFSGKNNLILKESFDFINFDYIFANQKILFENFRAKKNKGDIFGGYSFDMNHGKSKVWGNITNLQLNEINTYTQLPLHLNGKLNGLVKGEFGGENSNLEATVSLSNSTIINKPITDSFLNIKLKNQILDINSSFLGEKFKAKSRIVLDEKSKDKSIFSMNVDIDKMSDVISIFSFVDQVNSDFSGRMKLKLNSEFDVYNYKALFAELNLEELELNKSEINVNYKNKLGSQIIVNNGKINRWDLDIRGSNFYIISNGKGNIRAEYDILTKTKIDATLLEIFNVLISKADGTIITKINNFNNGTVEDYTATIVSSDLELSSDFMPLAITKGNMLLRYKKKFLYLDRFFAQLNSGSLKILGKIDVNNVIPEVDLRYEFSNAGLTLFKKSSLLFSGKGSLIGKTIPYTLGGDLSIQKLNIINEITDFGGSGGLVSNEIDYLPENSTKGLDQFLNLNININTLEPIRISNSMANIGFTGNLLVSGGERDPRLSGKFSLAPIKNQIYFKNNIFNLSKGNLFFIEKNSISNPELDFQAESNINDYKIYIKVIGPVKDFQLDLLSEPALAKSDILSLVAFGFTEDLSSDLSDSEKESMTKAGVGSIIFDRFKINETLKNEFGLQVNLGTEITQEEGSFLSRRNSSGDVGKVRSATKIEVKKQISDAVGLSVSSTVGSSAGQRQSMNLNYNINKNLSFEGVYENRSDTESDNVNDDTSLGADVKIRWSFK